MFSPISRESGDHFEVQCSIFSTVTPILYQKIASFFDQPITRFARKLRQAFERWKFMIYITHMGTAKKTTGIFGQFRKKDHYHAQRHRSAYHNIFEVCQLSCLINSSFYISKWCLGAESIIKRLIIECSELINFIEFIIGKKSFLHRLT